MLNKHAGKLGPKEGEATEHVFSNKSWKKDSNKKQYKSITLDSLDTILLTYILIYTSYKKYLLPEHFFLSFSLTLPSTLAFLFMCLKDISALMCP